MTLGDVVADKPPDWVPVQREGAHEQSHDDLGHERAGQEGDGQQGHLAGPGLLDVAQLHVDGLHDLRDLEHSGGRVSRPRPGGSKGRRGGRGMEEERSGRTERNGEGRCLLLPWK